MPNGTPTLNRPLARLALRITSCAHQGLERLIRLLHLLLHLGRSLLDLFQTLRTALTQPSTSTFRDIGAVPMTVRTASGN
nr:agnoprotein 2b [Gammapolyomavirus avis]WPM83278.1 agnoprotein 2b [Gammapolyomavirus avis]WPM83284.1 agnoprotein 2b [Gammapolyomavirus avis]